VVLPMPPGRQSSPGAGARAVRRALSQFPRGQSSESSRTADCVAPTAPWSGTARPRRILYTDRRDEIVTPSHNGGDVAIVALSVAEGTTQRADWIFRFASSTNVLGQARAISSSLLTTSPARSTRAVRISNARLPSRTGLSPSSRRRCAARSRYGPKETSTAQPPEFTLFYPFYLRRPEYTPRPSQRRDNSGFVEGGLSVPVEGLSDVQYGQGHPEVASPR